MNVIDEYLAPLTPEKRALLEHIRALVHETVPDIEECMSYGMPSFRYKPLGKVVLGFAATKKGAGVYPHSGSTLRNIKSDLSPYQSAPSALQTTAELPIPDEIIKELLSVRLQEILDNYGTKK